MQLALSKTKTWRSPVLAAPPWTEMLHDWVTTVDHKKIGILYVLMAVVFLIIGGVEAILIRLQTGG